MVDIEYLQGVLRRLKGVYKLTSDVSQKHRVKEQMNNVQNDIAILQRNKCVTADADNHESDSTQNNTYEMNESEQQGNADNDPISKTDETSVLAPPPVHEEQIHHILKPIEIKKIHEENHDADIDRLYAYLYYFEMEYWAALSKVNLDYHNSQERDAFFSKLENCKRLFKDYIDILETIHRAPRDEDKRKMRLMREKQSRALIIEIAGFFISIRAFIDAMIQNYDEGSNIILNPDEQIKFSKFEGNKILRKMKIIDALRITNTLITAMLDTISIPDFKKR